VIDDPKIKVTVEIEPWHCDACCSLIYNLDANGHPTPGAPDPKYFDVTWQHLCTACFELVSAIRGNTYFKRLQEARETKYREMRRNPGQA
jgi:hypothetical protein